VDPENRLIAATLEKKWESALAELQQAQEELVESKASSPVVPRVPEELRQSFADIGRRLPLLWPRLAAEARKSLLRTLIAAVNLFRDSEGIALIRIVWRGGAVTEKRIRVPVHSLRYSNTENKVAERISQLTERGLTIPQIIGKLNEEQLAPCRGGEFTTAIVIKLKKRYGIISNLEQLRRGRGVPFAYTVNEMAGFLKIHPSWLYRQISEGMLRIEKDPTYGCYLFPRTPDSIRQLKRLKKGAVPHASFQKVQHSG
jgi:hypothetical protein